MNNNKTKILLGPVWSNGLKSYETDNLEIRIFSYEEGGDYRVNSYDSLDKIISFSGDWKPDLVLYQQTTHGPLLKGIENSPLPVAGIIADGWLFADKIKRIIPYYDALITCESYIAEFLRNNGCKYIIEHTFHGYNIDLHKKIPGLPKIYDITYIGVPYIPEKTPVYGERFRYLNRISEYFKGRYKLFYKSNIYGDEYGKILNQSKIIFNYSPTGFAHIITTRIYESLVCGSLVFIEDSNTDSKKLFKDRVHCIYYNEKNLEELLEYYIENDEEREKIAEQGYLASYQYSLDSQILGMINKIKETGLDNLREERFQKRNISTVKFMLDSGFTSVLSTDGHLHDAEEAFNNVLSIEPSCAEAENGIAVINMAYALKNNYDTVLLRKALKYFKKAVLRKPGSVIYLFNLAHCQLLIDPDKAKLVFEMCIKKLEENVEDGEIFSGLIHTGYFSTVPNYLWIYDSSRFGYAFSIEKLKEIFVDRSSFFEGLKSLFLSHCWEKIGDIQQNNNYFENAIDSYKISVKYRSDNADIIKKIAYCFEKNEKNNLSAEQLIFAIKIEPFNMEIRELCLNSLLITERYDEAEELRLKTDLLKEAL